MLYGLTSVAHSTVVVPNQREYPYVESYIVRYAPDAAGGWSAERFIAAVRAEGVPIEQERYALKAIRGDFRGVADEAGDHRRALEAARS